MASAPALSASRASARVVAQANHPIPRSFKLFTNPEGYTPMIDETTVGLTAKKTSHFFSKSEELTLLASSGTGGPHCKRKFRTSFSASGSRTGIGFRNPMIQLKRTVAQ